MIFDDITKISSATVQAEVKVQRGVSLDTGISKCLPILKLFTVEDEGLPALNPVLNIVDPVRWRHLESDGLWASEAVHENPHAKVKEQGGLSLDMVIGERPPILKLVATEEEPLLGKMAVS